MQEVNVNSNWNFSNCMTPSTDVFPRNFGFQITQQLPSHPHIYLPQCGDIFGDKIYFEEPPSLWHMSTKIPPPKLQLMSLLCLNRVIVGLTCVIISFLGKVAFVIVRLFGYRTIRMDFKTT